jgi:hypothetical protein
MNMSGTEEAGPLKRAIDRNDIERVKTMMTRNPALHRAPLGYGEDGPLTWVAECEGCRWRNCWWSAAPTSAYA